MFQVFELNAGDTKQKSALHQKGHTIQVKQRYIPKKKIV